jgi:hypothetical protein
LGYCTVQGKLPASGKHQILDIQINPTLALDLVKNKIPLEILINSQQPALNISKH